jgi:hypothetical protein
MINSFCHERHAFFCCKSVVGVNSGIILADFLLYFVARLGGDVRQLSFFIFWCFLQSGFSIL